jgi:RNA polymerase sigma-70 factor (ECF subfamily)
VDELTNLLVCAQHGDRAAFAQFAVRIEFILLCYLRMSPRTRAVCNEADDLIQETLLRCWKHLPEFTGAPGAAVPWAWAICRNLAVDLLRRRSSRTTLSLDGPQGKKVQVPAGRPTPEAVAEAREAWALLHRILARLRPEVRQLIRCHYLNGWSHARCAEHLGMTPDAFNMKLFRARQALQQSLAGHDLAGDSLQAAGELFDDATDGTQQTMGTRGEP